MRQPEAGDCGHRAAAGAEPRSGDVSAGPSKSSGAVGSPCLCVFCRGSRSCQVGLFWCSFLSAQIGVRLRCVTVDAFSASTKSPEGFGRHGLSAAR